MARNPIIRASFDPGRHIVIDPDKPVRVIRNWKHDCYTILQNGRPKASAKQVRLADVEFLVRTSGRNKMLRERKRNVHAYAVGRLIDYTHPDEDRVIEPIRGRSIAYKPYHAATFVDVETDTPVSTAKVVHFQENGVFYHAV
jgi:hypothetical protein